MFQVRSAFLTVLAISASPPVSPPARVAAVTIEDLIRYSDAIVVGKVERIEVVHRPPEEVSPPQEFVGDLGTDIPFADVAISRVLKGPAESKRVIYLATSTWTCDITTAEVGETVLLFLGDASRSDLFDGNLRQRVRASLPMGDWMEVMWSGRGRMPLRTIEGVEHATCWVSDVVLPMDAPTIDGPEREYSDFIRSVPLAWMREKIRSCVKSQQELWFKASVSEVGDSSMPWDLEVALDGHARLVVHGLGGDREERFKMSGSRLMDLTRNLRMRRREEPPEKIGSGVPVTGVRRLQVVPPEPAIDLRILEIDERWMRLGDQRQATLPILRAWDLIRASFDEPGCADHRGADAPWKPSER